MSTPTIAVSTDISKSDEDILSPEQKAIARIRGLGHVYQTTDRILSGGTVDVRVEHHPIDVSAWTDGSTITINAAVVTKVDAESVERMNGLNAHELAHVLYTPRKGTSLVSWVLDHGYHQAFNLLEDQRIESLLTGRYPSTAPWLSATIARWVLSGESTKDTGYLYVRGRKYLDGRLRGALRASFIRQDLLSDIDRVIDEYRTLVFGADYDRARELIAEFAVIMNEVIDTAQQQQAPQDGGSVVTCPHGHGQRPDDVLSSGRPKGVSEQRRDSDRMDDGDREQVPSTPQSTRAPDIDDDDEFDDESAGFGDSDDDFDDGEGDTSSEGESEGDNDTSSAPASGTPSGAPSPSASTPSTEPGDGAGIESGSDTTVEEVAQQVLNEILNDAEIRDDIRRTQRQIQAQGGGDTLKKSDWVPRAPLPEYARLLGGLRKSLTRLVAKADPGWESRQSSGRVNALRWAQERNLDTAFDLWDEGVHDAVDMEVVILIDESGSMQTVIEQASNAMWVVKRALDRIGASTTVISFDDQCRTLYHRRDKANGQVRFAFHSGGTDPTDGLEQAAQIFAGSRRSQKILILLTDGDWYQRYEGVTAREYIARLNSAGVTTALGYISGREGLSFENVKSHGCGLKAVVSGPTLATFISSIVSTSIKSRLRGR